MLRIPPLHRSPPVAIDGTSGLAAGPGAVPFGAWHDRMAGDLNNK
jgi:hypothetical protein